MTLTKSDLKSIKDIVDTSIDQKLDTQSKRFDQKLDAQSKRFDQKLDAQSKEIISTLSSFIHDNLLKYEIEQDDNIEKNKRRIERLEHHTGIATAL